MQNKKNPPSPKGFEGAQPKPNPSSCSYCADAPVNHFFSFWASFFFDPLDDHMVRTSYRAPKFIKDFVDWLGVALLTVLAFLRLAKFSADIEKVKTFRSRVIWEEAKRRGIEMEELILFGKPLDHYRAKIKNKTIYFESLPIPPESLDMRRNWDDKFVLKDEFIKHGIPVPRYALPSLFRRNLEKIFSELDKPLIVKPKLCSRGRHTLINIKSLLDLEEAVEIASEISPH